MSDLIPSIGTVLLSRRRLVSTADHLEIRETADRGTVLVLVQGDRNGLRGKTRSMTAACMIAESVLSGRRADAWIPMLQAAIPPDKMGAQSRPSFSMLHLCPGAVCRMIWTDAPAPFFLHRGTEAALTPETICVAGWELFKTSVPLLSADYLLLMSEGCLKLRTAGRFSRQWDRGMIPAILDPLISGGESGGALAEYFEYTYLRQCGKAPPADVTFCAVSLNEQKAEHRK